MTVFLMKGITYIAPCWLAEKSFSIGLPRIATEQNPFQINRVGIRGIARHHICMFRIHKPAEVMTQVSVIVIISLDIFVVVRFRYECARESF
jgi:hypothetical protein